MNKNFQRVVLVGAFPPPVHGMAAVNAVMKEALQKIGSEPRVINVAAQSLDRSPIGRVGRMPRVLRGLVILAFTRGLHGKALYMSVSGGLGQIYELLFVSLARLRGMRLFLHHHSFAYLDKRSWLTAWLAWVAGGSTMHVTLSPRMAQCLRSLYKINHTVVISNAAVLLSRHSALAEPRRQLHTLGFISNLAPEKGVIEFLDLMEAVLNLGLPVRAKLAGPYQDAATERIVMSRLSVLPNVDYLGPRYGADKDAFFAGIDLLIFPTRYVNEAEPLTLHEAMSCGVPVIAYGRGAIPEIVGSGVGKSVDPAEPFVPAALAQIKAWFEDAAAFEAVSMAAAARFNDTYAQNEMRYQMLLNELVGASPA